MKNTGISNQNDYLSRHWPKYTPDLMVGSVFGYRYWVTKLRFVRGQSYLKWWVAPHIINEAEISYGEHNNS